MRNYDMKNEETKKDMVTCQQFMTSQDIPVTVTVISYYVITIVSYTW
jgi:hypothetical protein